MCEKYVERPLYLLIADWMMAENRWITAREISRQFDIEHCKAINTLSYILSEVGEIVCEVKMIPNQIAGRGCQCQRLVKVVSIDSQLYRRLNHNLQERKVSVAVAWYSPVWGTCPVVLTGAAVNSVLPLPSV